MTDRGKTIMCGVLFLDISEYSKKSVSGQISLKERFNAYLSVAIRDVPIDDRIILDTGDGAALSFLGDIGDALQVALSMRESLREGLHMEPPLLVRMGINLGPVRLIRDLNGQPNIVGDGINVAQRVMGFADPGQILVSRSYYDAVSRLSPEYASMFHYQGSRTDKHVREHEIYAIGYPGEFTGTLTLSGEASQGRGESTRLSKRLARPWKAIAAAYREASTMVRIIYAGLVLVPSIAVVALGIALLRSAPPAPNGQAAISAPASQVLAIVPASAVVAVVPVSAPVALVAEGHDETLETSPAHEAMETPEQEARERAEGKELHGVAGKAPAKPKKKTREKKAPSKKAAEQQKAPDKRAKPGTNATISVACTGANVFIDGQPKGSAGKSPMTIQVSPGHHLVMLLLPGKSQVYSRDLDLAAGKTVKISPNFCR